MWKCTKCDLCIRSNSLPPVGQQTSDIMLILNHPDYYENKHNKALDSPRGNHLVSILKTFGLSEYNVYTTYVTKCKPEDIATPHQLDVCTSAYLNWELQNVKPKIIITFHREVISNLSKLLNVTLNEYSEFQTSKNYAIFLMPNPVKYSKTGDNRYPMDKFEGIIRFYQKYINPYHLY